MEPVESTIVDPITEKELASLAESVNIKLNSRFTKKELAEWRFSHPEIARAFMYETFLALRIFLHRKSRQ